MSAEGFTAKVTARSQATTPKPIRDKLQLKAGDRVAYREERGRVYLERVPEDGTPAPLTPPHAASKPPARKTRELDHHRLHEMLTSRR